MRPSVFEYESYQNYLNEALTFGERSRGRKAALARHLSCQTSYISQILTSRVHLSLEHAMRVSEFLQHSGEEQNCFLLLIQKDKAGTELLKEHFRNQVSELRKSRQHVKERVRLEDEISSKDTAMYYNNWWYSAIHVTTALAEVNTREDISRMLGVPPDIVGQVLDFLVSRGLVQEKNGRYSIGKARVHVGSRSPLVTRHHANWRLKAVEVQERMHPRNLHFSEVVAISKKDGDRIRALALDFLQNTEKIITPSKEERPFVLLLDFFKLSGSRDW